MRETNTLSHGSILSFPDRGPWGNSRYRGNRSGYVYKRIFEHLRPRVFTDPMVGSGTSVEVAREMGIEAYGLDLHSGFNILKTSILATVGKPSDLVLSHPPYHDIIPYSGSEWGRGGEPLFLDTKHRVLGFDRLFTGTIDGATIYPREVVKKALQYNAAAVILAHNHPSGVAEPSRADELLTHRLKEALAVVEIRVLDHIIIAGCDTVSLAERGAL